jgi:uncharacterized RDD family membrane protein YckC
MQTENPYQTPQSDVSNPPPLPSEYNQLAGRWERLGAAIVDGLILLVITAPLMYFGGYFNAAMEAAQRGQQLGIGQTLLWTAIGFVIFAAVQAYPLNLNGQTWGKKLLDIKIVDLAGSKPELATLFLKRYLPIHAISAIPIAGGIFGLVNVLFIFRADKRCIHDLIAGTRVVSAK